MKELPEEQKKTKFLKKLKNEKNVYVAGRAILGLAFAFMIMTAAVAFSGIYKFNGKDKDEAMKKEEKIYEDATLALGLTCAALTAVGGPMYVLGHDYEKETFERENAYWKRREEEINDKCISRVDLIERKH